MAHRDKPEMVKSTLAMTPFKKTENKFGGLMGFNGGEGAFDEYFQLFTDSL